MPTVVDQTPGRLQLEHEVFPAEWKEIWRRRRALKGGRTHRAGQAQKPAAGKPFFLRWMRHFKTSSKGFEQTASPAIESEGPGNERPPNLVGLALSGGGIRSATFNLGVIQALADHGVLQDVDYLSTVSGGGYIGSSLSSVLNTGHAGPKAPEFPFHHQPGVEEPKAFRHLRNHANYLAPRGLVDKLRIPALLLRGMVINFLVILPYVVLAVGLTHFFYGAQLQEAAASGAAFDWKQFYRVTPWACAVPLLWILAFPLMQRFYRRSWSLRDHYEKSFGILMLLIAGVALIETQPLAIYYYSKGLQTGLRWTWLMTALGGLLSPTAGKLLPHISKWTGKLALYAFGLLGPLVFWLIYLRLSVWTILGAAPQWLPLAARERDAVYILGAVLYFVYNLVVNVNDTSLHSFYRDRLSKAYLFKVNEKGSIVPGDEQKLSDLNAPGTKAPYHLLNAALNLQDSKDINLRGRNADFFIFSKHFVGSERTGYCRTRDMEEEDAHLNLGTAMAISGAAAAPNMGAVTIKPLVFVMTLLNIRLGYWLRNPRYRKSATLREFSNYAGKHWPRVGPAYLLLELFGKLDERSANVNVSDGGHLENLGLYELLRRRVKVIIVGDAEADPNMTFAGLAKVIRYARIDMAIGIDIDLETLRKAPNGFSRRHCALGKIDYGQGETGLLVYIKASVTGDENEYIQEYHSRQAEFPHESTADQFFDEAQFEAYRALGYHVAAELFAKRSHEEETEAAVERAVTDHAWVRRVQIALRPRSRREEEVLRLQKQLAAIERQFRNPLVSSYTYEIYPELVEAGPEGVQAEEARTGEMIREIFHLCNQQIKFMENVYVTLQLDRSAKRTDQANQTWMRLFRRWAEAPSFRRAWKVSAGACDAGFRSFCEEAFRLPPVEHEERPAGVAKPADAVPEPAKKQ